MDRWRNPTVIFSTRSRVRVYLTAANDSKIAIDLETAEIKSRARWLWNSWSLDWRWMPEWYCCAIRAILLSSRPTKKITCHDTYVYGKDIYIQERIKKFHYYVILIFKLSRNSLLYKHHISYTAQEVIKCVYLNWMYCVTKRNYTFKNKKKVLIQFSCNENESNAFRMLASFLWFLIKISSLSRF